MSLGKEGDMLVCELGAHERKTLQRFGVADHSRWNHSSKDGDFEEEGTRKCAMQNWTICKLIYKEKNKG